MQLKLTSPKIFLATQAVDFRCSVNGLCGLAQEHLSKELKEGIFIFYSRDRKKLKLLTWHRNGFVLVYKRLEQGKFYLRATEEGALSIDEKQLGWLLAGLDWAGMSDWKELEFDDYF